LHEFEAVLQAEVPLQEFTPSHFTFASSALAVLMVAVAKTSAAAEARARPDSFFEFIIISLLDWLRQTVAKQSADSSVG
jgi:hypothetical protein